MEVQSPSSLATQLSVVTAEVAQELERLQEVEQQSLRLRERAEAAESLVAALQQEIERLKHKPGPPPPPVEEEEVEVTVKAPASGIVAFGHVFRPGRIRGLAAKRPGGESVPIQMSVLRTAPDGSVRHALIAAEVGPGYEGTLKLLSVPERQVGNWSGPTSLTAEARISVAGREYVARPEGTGDVSAEGEIVSARRFRASFLDPDGKPHPQLTALFDVVFTRGDVTWAAIGIENCLALPEISKVEEIVYDARFICEDREHRETGVRHFPFARWRHIFDLGGLGEAKLDVAYLVSTAAVPSYDVDRYAGKSLDKFLKQFDLKNRSVLKPGIVEPSMPAGGMTRLDIGPLPGWDAAAVLSQDPRVFAISRAAGEDSGAFPVHYRDRATGLPYSVVDHPSASIHTNNTGSREGDRLPKFRPGPGGQNPDTDHSPSLGYLPYLLQPWDSWMLEEVHFWVGFLELSRPWRDGYRKGADGLLRTGALRGYSWSMRTLALAAWITPDAHPQRGMYERLLINNLEDSAAQESPLGWWGSGRKSGPGVEWMADDVTDLTVPWQHDFGIVVWDWIVRLGYPKAAAFRDLLIRGLRGRFLEGPAVHDGTNQHLAVISKEGPYASWAEIHRKTFEKRPAAEAPTDFWHTNRPFDYGAIARVSLHRAVNGAGAEDLRPVLEQIDASCERYADVYDSDPRWRIV
ncbi:MAG: hypothetical protein QOH06_4611 [Acidobacteriota bacterium]|jgi:hypothetical protein|nr:hypothetical protein [Acidobacteriota bacterium]